MNKVKWMICGLLALCGAGVSGAMELYISPEGNDQNTGTIEQPFATLTAARNAVRSMDQANRDITV